MIIKSVMFLLFCSSISYGNSVVKLIKDDDNMCMIKRSIGEDTNCSKKDTYFLKVDDKVKSTKLKISTFTYITGDSSIFVSEIDDGYKIEKSFLAYLGSLYKNYMYPNKNDGENGTLGAKVDISFIPSYTKVFYGKKIYIEINDNEKNIQYSLEDNDGKDIILPKIKNNIISIDTKKLFKNKKYTLEIWSENNNQTMTFEFLQGRNEEIYKKYLELNANDKSKYREALFNELSLQLR